MDIRLAIFDFLTSTVPLSSAVRNDARQALRDLVEDRVFIGHRPQNTPGFSLVLNYAGGTPFNGLSEPVDSAAPIIDFELWSETKQQANWHELMLSVRQLFHQYRGPLNVTVSTQGIFLEGEPIETAFSPNDASDRWILRKTMPFMVQHSLAVPSLATTNFVSTATEDTSGDIVLASNVAWTPDADASDFLDANAIGKHAWRIGENDNIAEQIEAIAIASGVEYQVLVRYRYEGTNVGASRITFTQASETAITIGAVNASTLYEGSESYGGVSGYYDVGNVTLTSGNVVVVVEGPTTSSDRLILDQVVLSPT